MLSSVSTLSPAVKMANLYPEVCFLLSTPWPPARLQKPPDRDTYPTTAMSRKLQTIRHIQSHLRKVEHSPLWKLLLNIINKLHENLNRDMRLNSLIIIVQNPKP